MNRSKEKISRMDIIKRLFLRHFAEGSFDAVAILTTARSHQLKNIAEAIKLHSPSVDISFITQTGRELETRKIMEDAGVIGRLPGGTFTVWKLFFMDFMKIRALRPYTLIIPYNNRAGNGYSSLEFISHCFFGAEKVYSVFSSTREGIEPTTIAELTISQWVEKRIEPAGYRALEITLYALYLVVVALYLLRSGVDMVKKSAKAG